MINPKNDWWFSCKLKFKKMAKTKHKKTITSLQLHNAQLGMCKLVNKSKN